MCYCRICPDLFFSEEKLHETKIGTHRYKPTRLCGLLNGKCHLLEPAALETFLGMPPCRLPDTAVNSGVFSSGF